MKPKGFALPTTSLSIVTSLRTGNEKPYRKQIGSDRIEIKLETRKESIKQCNSDLSGPRQGQTTLLKSVFENLLVLFYSIMFM